MILPIVGAQDPVPVGVRRSTGYLPELEALRGIAIALVYLYHLRSTLVPRPEPVNPAFAFITAGNTGVTLFFVLSAFLLARPFLREAAGGRPVAVRDYYARRALRILPLYYFAVLVGTVVCARTPADLLHGVPYLFVVNAYVGFQAQLPPFSNVWWTLATEAQFYLVLPLLAVVLRPGRGAWLVLAVFLICTIYAAFLTGTLHWTTIPGQMALSGSLIGQGPVFLCGIVAAAVYERAGRRMRAACGRRRWLRAGGADVALAVVLLALGLLLAWETERGLIATEQIPIVAWHVLEAALWATVVLFLVIAPLRTTAIFSNPITKALGTISYSLYLVHLPIMLAVLMGTLRRSQGLGTWNLRFGLVAAAVTAACVGVSALTYRFIERPFLAKKALLDR